jgi:GNAT superfamily N-acetyltransferase
MMRRIILTAVVIMATAVSYAQSLRTTTDSLSYAAGMAMTDGLLPYLKQSFGVDSTHMNDFLRGFEEAVKKSSDPIFKAYMAGMQIAQMVQQRYNLHTVRITKEDIYGPKKYGHRVFDVINRTFGHLYGYSEMSEKQMDEYVDMYFKFVDLEMLCLVEDWNTPDHDLIGVGITIPSLTRALQKCRNGRLWPFGWWHLMRALYFKKTDIVDCLLIGVLPEYRKKGANSLLFYHLIPIFQKYGFKWGETHVEMETNDKVQSQWMYYDHEQHKRRRCYKKAL